MDKDKKLKLFKYITLVSFVCGFVGIFFVIRGLKTPGLILIGVWAVCYVINKILILSMKKK
jgi:hypothetical protein